MPTCINLTTLLQQGRSTVIATHLASGAAIESIQIVDQQVAAINYAQIQGGFDGAAQMAQAVWQMQQAASHWPPVKASIMTAAQAGVAAGPLASAVGNGDTTAAQLAEHLQSFQAQTLNPLIAQFAASEQQFNTFSQSMDQAYDMSANANQSAAAAIRMQQLMVNNEIAQLQANIDNLSSAGSIITGIFSLGISYAVEISNLRDQQNRLQNDEQRQQYQYQCYQNSLGTFNNALNATKLASYALSTLGTSLQQASNKLSTISTMTNSNLIVMQAELQAFKAEFAQAVITIQQLIA
jgi:predicted  nucleic acid-binding Zn-ribbon protein